MALLDLSMLATFKYDSFTFLPLKICPLLKQLNKSLNIYHQFLFYDPVILKKIVPEIFRKQNHIATAHTSANPQKNSKLARLFSLPWKPTSCTRMQADKYYVHTYKFNK